MRKSVQIFAALALTALISTAALAADTPTDPKNRLHGACMWTHAKPMR